MGWLTKAAQGVRSKLTGKVGFPGRALVWFDLNRPREADMSDSVGDGTGSDVVMSPVRWLWRALRESQWQHQDGDQVLDDSDLVALLNQPNPFYDGGVLLDGTAMSMATDGNAYWIAALNADGRPVELWYAPHMNVEPRWPSDDPRTFLTHYTYTIAGGEQKIAPAGVAESDLPADLEPGLRMIHFREGIDPKNLRKGLSPLKGLLREVWTDNEAAAYTAALLKNSGIPGVVVAPANKDDRLTPKEAEATEAKLKTKYRANNRGNPLVMLGATKIDTFGFSPRELDLAPIRNIAEERVTAALGIPAAVVGFGAGLQQTKVGATMKELRREAWTGGVLPLQRLLERGVTACLAPDFGGGRVLFDNADVAALREDEDAKAARAERLVRASIITRGEAREDLNREVGPADDVYLVQLSTLEVPRTRGAPAPPSPEQAADETRRWAAAYLEKQHSHGGPEDRIIEAAPSRPATAEAARMARDLEAVRRRASSLFEDPLRRVFDALGENVLRIAQEALEDDDEERADPVPVEVKQGELGPLDIALVERILDGTDTVAAQAALQESFETGYLATAGQVSGALGDAFPMGDAAQRNVLRAGGLRAGLVDLSTQTRGAVFSALESGRELGLTADNLARHIRDHVEAGPWRDAATRARVIARTEGAHAANVSTLEAAREADDTEHVQVFDNRSGTDDELCVAANGSIITIDEAEAIGLAHPNCTRSFVPINGVLLEEMGLAA